MPQERKPVRRDYDPKPGYLGAIIVNGLLLFAFYRVPRWDVPFISESFPAVLGPVGAFLGATMVANAIWLAYDAPWLKSSVQLLLDALGAYAVYTLYRVFPFDLAQEALTQAVKVALLAGLVVIGFTIAFDLAALLRVVGRRL